MIRTAELRGNARGMLCHYAGQHKRRWDLHARCSKVSHK